MTDNEFLLQDRLGVIRDTIKKYGEENFCIAFSGGKDSTIIHHLVDMALPDNKIPRVYSNTGIEYLKIVDFVKELASKDDRFIILKPKKNIKKTLEEKGYPFKSKEYSQCFNTFKNNEEKIREYFEKIDADNSLLDNYDFIHSLPKGVKWTIKYIYGIRERDSKLCNYALFPDILKYQFTDKDFKLNISDKCCLEMKEKPLIEWETKNNKTCKILGLMRDEGGRRVTTKCVAFENNKMSFSPLAKVTKEWEEWFINEYNIQLCELYYPPYNFDRTGCKGCPYNINLQRELTTLETYFPNERKQCEMIWKPIYEEYRRIGYRLDSEEQTKLL